MEIKALDQQISSGTIGRLYFFWGDEQFLLWHKVRAIKSRIVQKDFEDFNFVKLDSKKISAADIDRETAAVPVMSDRRLVVVQNSGIFDNTKTKDFKEVYGILEDLPEYLCLIFVEQNFDRKKEKNLDVFKKYGEIVKFDSPSPVQLERWLEKMFDDAGKSVLLRDLRTMIERSGQNMQTLFNEFQKLIAFTGERTKITERDICTVVSKSTETRIFDLVENIALGKNEGVFDELGAMRQSGENPATVMSLITSRLCDLLLVKQLTSERIAQDQIAQYFEPRKPDFAIKKLINQCRYFDECFLIDMVLKGPEYTAKVRSGVLDKWVAVEMYSAALLKKQLHKI